MCARDRSPDSAMACTKSKREPSPSQPSPSSLGDALLLATMCIIGLPVEVQVKDGSVYSGIFHTAHADKDYAVILKKARKIGQERCNNSFEVGALIDTLVVLSADLVQVVAKEVLIPVEEINNDDADHVIEGANRSVVAKDYDSPTEEVRQVKSPTKMNICQNEQNHWNGQSKFVTRKIDLNVSRPAKPSVEVERRNMDITNFEGNEASLAATYHSIPGRQAEESLPVMVSDVHVERTALAEESNKVLSEQFQDMQISSAERTTHRLESFTGGGEEMITNNAGLYSCHAASVKSRNSGVEMTRKSCLSALDSNAVISSVSPSPVLNISCSTSSPSLGTVNALPASAKVSSIGTNQRGFKLNPGAKNFLPSYARPQHAATVQTPSTTLSVASAPFIPGNSSFVLTGGMQPAAEINPLPRLPSAPPKFVVYNNIASQNYSTPHHRPVVSWGTRSSLTRPNGQQYLPVQVGAAHTYLHAHSATTDRTVQHLYVQPLHDPLPFAPLEFTLPSPPPPPRPLMNPYQFNVPKLQPSPVPPVLQPCAVPPIITGHPQLYPAFAHPVHVVQAIPVPGPNSTYETKFYA